MEPTARASENSDCKGEGSNAPSRTPAFSLMPPPSGARKVHRRLLVDAELLGRGRPGHLCPGAAASPAPALPFR